MTIFRSVLSLMMSLGLAATAVGADTVPALRLERTATGAWSLVRDGRPFRVNGIGGSVRYEQAARLGANAARTWGAEQAETVIPAARAAGLMVAVGFWLSHDAKDYRDEAYKQGMRDEVRTILARWAGDPAVLCWTIGNETNLGADTDEAWAFIGELAALCKALDPRHPVMTVLAHPGITTMDRMARLAPAVDILGVNSYAGMPGWSRSLARSAFTGPYMYTEWGVNGHWEVAKTPWGAPIEQTSSEKAAVIGERWRQIDRERDRCLGSFVFLWGQKQERTPTWYSLFVERRPELGLDGEMVAAVDVLARGWTGRAPAGGALDIAPLRIAGAETRHHETDGTPFTVTVDARDPDGDPLTYRYEVLAEATVLGTAGSREPRPAAIPDAVRGSGPEATVTVAAPGTYRLFAYVLDGTGRVATANLPFRVASPTGSP
ncbi:MAG: hypothetical protein RLZZ127_97 [Planctomycetota bacterium]|jgi:hypothetical protein